MKQENKTILAEQRRSGRPPGEDRRDVRNKLLDAARILFATNEHLSCARNHLLNHDPLQRRFLVILFCKLKKYVILLLSKFFVIYVK